MLEFSFANRNPFEILWNTKEELVFTLFSYLDAQALCRLVQVCNQSALLASNDDCLWKPLCVSKWSELKMASGVDSDPYPAWKNCFKRKRKEGVTTLNELAQEFGDCDFYSCPNGHLYLIGECRKPMKIGRCPTCHVRIGGRDHRRLGTNERIGPVKQHKDNKLAFEDIQVNKISRNPTKEPRKNEVLPDDFDDQSAEIPFRFIDPISKKLMNDPVLLPTSKRIVDRSTIVEHLKKCDTDPFNYTPLSLRDVFPARNLRTKINKWKRRYD